MKKIILLFIIFLVPFSFCLGQAEDGLNNEDQKNWEHYVSCTYIREFLKIKHSDNQEAQKIVEDLSNIEFQYSEANKNNRVNSIVQRCSDINIKESSSIYGTIQKRKIQEPNIFCAIPMCLKEYEGQMTVISRQLKDTLNGYLKAKREEAKINNNKVNRESKQNESNANDGFSLTEIILLSIALLELIAIIYFVICWEKKTEKDDEPELTGNEQLKATRKQEQKIGELNAEINKLKRENDQLKRENDQLKRDNKTLVPNYKKQKEVPQPKSNTSVAKPSKITTEVSKPVAETKKEPIQVIKHDYTGYLAQFDGESFGRLKDKKDLCNFAIFDKKTDSAKFEFCGDDKVAIAQYDVVFDSIADWEGDPQNASSVQLITPGEVRFIDERWKVTTKAKIKFV